MNVCTKNSGNLTKFNCQMFGGLNYFVKHTHTHTHTLRAGVKNNHFYLQKQAEAAFKKGGFCCVYDEIRNNKQ
ncbi:hypothetical protein AGMMS49965_22010 [Bacteroidia bacterium]|nr:hypothetical protein AGMMS49965_22010 [Bacteroidia bacterium]